jgi:hypothetical protein
MPGAGAPQGARQAPERGGGQRNAMQRAGRVVVRVGGR